MNWLGVIGISIGSLVALLPVALVAYINVGGFYYALKQTSRAKFGSTVAASPLVCNTNIDCPEGYVCVNGRCVAEPS